MNGLPQETDPAWRNVAHFIGTGILKGVGALAGTPHTIAALGDKATDAMVGDAAIPYDPGNIDPEAKTPAYVAGQPGFLTRHTYSPDEVNNALFTGLSNASQAVGRGPRYPYEPTSDTGKIAMAGLSNIIPAMVGPSRIMSTVARESAGIAGGAGAEAYSLKNPDDYWGQLGVGLASAVAGGVAPGLIKSGLTSAGSLVRPGMAETAAGPKVAQALASAAGVPGSDLAQTIETNLPQWTPGTRPDLGNVTENTGLRGLVYQDQVAAKRAQNPIYQENAMMTNAAQRSAVTGSTPSDAATTLQQMTTDRDMALNAVPQGVDAQTAGNLIRQNLQGVQDQRMAARSASAANPYDVLRQSDAQVTLRPLMDDVTKLAASNAGEVGQAYQRALDQFKSPTGITLDTAPFADSVLKGLGDLSASYPRGSAAARAVNDVKSQAEALIGTQAPEVGVARQTWAEASRPLDVFDSPPFGKVLATDRFGHGYTMPADEVTSTFLRGNGSADALDALNNIFPNRETATRALQDYMAGQVRQNALMPDGSINIDAMNRTLRPFQSALIRFPQLRDQFSTAAGAQRALEQQMAYQSLYDRVTTGLGGQAQDAAGNQMYSPAKFQNFVDQNRDLINRAYTPEQAAVVNRVNTELQNAAQTAQTKVPGTSGTPQHTLAVAGAHVGGGGLMGTVGGIVIGHIFGQGEIGALVGSQLGGVAGGLRLASRNAFETVRRNALTDPEYARALLVKYNPTGDSASVRAMQYIAQRTPVLTLPAPREQPIPHPAMQYQFSTTGLH